MECKAVKGPATRLNPTSCRSSSPRILNFILHPPGEKTYLSRFSSVFFPQVVKRCATQKLGKSLEQLQIPFGKLRAGSPVGRDDKIGGGGWKFFRRL
jgi:hypothetical protein